VTVQGSPWDEAEGKKEFQLSRISEADSVTLHVIDILLRLHEPPSRLSFPFNGHVGLQSVTDVVIGRGPIQAAVS